MLYSEGIDLNFDLFTFDNGYLLQKIIYDLQQGSLCTQVISYNKYLMPTGHGIKPKPHPPDLQAFVLSNLGIVKTYSTYCTHSYSIKWHFLYRTRDPWI